MFENRENKMIICYMSIGMIWKYNISMGSDFNLSLSSLSLSSLCYSNQSTLEWERKKKIAFESILFDTTLQEPTYWNILG